MITRLSDAIRASFGAASALAMLLGLLGGLGLPALDKLFAINLPVLSFDDQSTARSLLETIGTTTVAVAGLSISVTVVAFTLASSQLSPRVLRTFRGDRVSQLTLALFLGTFIYCLTLLVRLGVSSSEAQPPNLSITIAVLLAIASFLTFAVFIGHIVNMLQPSSVIAAIHADAQGPLKARYPSGPGEPEDYDQANEQAVSAISGNLYRVGTKDSGFLNWVDTGAIIEAATEADALVHQRLAIGSHAPPGTVIAEIWSELEQGSDDLDQLEWAICAAFNFGEQRTMVQDINFPIRQFADIALKGLSPSTNDPTTAENAVNTMTTALVEFARSEKPARVRVDSDGRPRFVAMVPDLDELVEVGFEQVRIFAEPYPVVSKRLLVLLDHLEQVAREQGCSTAEIERQRDLIPVGVGTVGPTDADVAEVERAAEQTTAPPPGEA